jgi:hypothetical protein
MLLHFAVEAAVDHPGHVRCGFALTGASSSELRFSSDR